SLERSTLRRGQCRYLSAATSATDPVLAQVRLAARNRAHRVEDVGPPWFVTLLEPVVHSPRCAPEEAGLSVLVAPPAKLFLERLHPVVAFVARDLERRKIVRIDNDVTARNSENEVVVEVRGNHLVVRSTTSLELIKSLSATRHWHCQLIYGNRSVSRI